MDTPGGDPRVPLHGTPTLPLFPAVLSQLSSRLCHHRLPPNPRSLFTASSAYSPSLSSLWLMAMVSGRTALPSTQRTALIIHALGVLVPSLVLILVSLIHPFSRPLSAVPTKRTQRAGAWHSSLLETFIYISCRLIAVGPAESARCVFSIAWNCRAARPQSPPGPLSGWVRAGRNE